MLLFTVVLVYSQLLAPLIFGVTVGFLFLGYLENNGWHFISFQNQSLK